MQGMEIACDSSSNTRLAVGRPRTIDGQCSPNHDGHYSAGEPCSCSQARLAFCHSLRLSESMGPKPVVSGNGPETEAACWCFPAALSGSTGFVAPFTKNVSVCLDERSRQGPWCSSGSMLVLVSQLGSFTMHTLSLPTRYAERMKEPAARARSLACRSTGD
jgi:hypothetical protein